MRSNLPTEKKLNTLVKKSVDLKPLQILGWKGIKSKNTAILTLKYPSWEQKVRRPRVKKSGDKKSGKTSNLQGKLVFVQKWGRRTFSMEIGWFWGEIRVLWWRQLINTAVGHYLWGIDTSQNPHTSSHHHHRVGHYLWGIDTDLRITFLFSMRRISSDITYEELIQINAAVFHSIPINFAIPLVGHYLWGIDTCSLWKTSTCDLSHKQKSDITYEELILLQLYY